MTKAQAELVLLCVRAVEAAAPLHQEQFDLIAAAFVRTDANLHPGHSPIAEQAVRESRPKRGPEAAHWLRWLEEYLAANPAHGTTQVKRFFEICGSLGKFVLNRSVVLCYLDDPRRPGKPYGWRRDPGGEWEWKSGGEIRLAVHNAKNPKGNLKR